MSEQKYSNSCSLAFSHSLCVGGRYNTASDNVVNIWNGRPAGFFWLNMVRIKLGCIITVYLCITNEIVNCFSTSQLRCYLDIKRTSITTWPNEEVNRHPVINWKKKRWHLDQYDKKKKWLQHVKGIFMWGPAVCVKHLQETRATGYMFFVTHYDPTFVQ